MDAETLHSLSMIMATIGIGLLAWPMIMRMRRMEQPGPADEFMKMRSKAWIAGFVLTVGAIFLQRMATGGG
jgi:hypothetical protein